VATNIAATQRRFSAYVGLAPAETIARCERPDIDKVVAVALADATDAADVQAHVSRPEPTSATTATAGLAWTVDGQQGRARLLILRLQTGASPLTEVLLADDGGALPSAVMRRFVDTLAERLADNALYL
jgi:hypothetical protein